MSRGLPSMTALLGMIALAGYQNRDKLSEMLGGLGGGQAQGAGSTGGLGGMLGGALGGGGMSGGMGGGGLGGAGAGGLGGLLGGLAGSLGGASAGSVLSGGLGGLVDRFRQNGQAEAVDSWVGTGPNREVAPPQLEQALGPDVLAQLTQHTGLSREELLQRLSRELPRAVDQYTPQGRLPHESEF